MPKKELHGRLTTELTAWQEVVRNEIPALNEQMRKHGVPNITVASGEAGEHLRMARFHLIGAAFRCTG